MRTHDQNKVLITESYHRRGTEIVSSMKTDLLLTTEDPCDFMNLQVEDSTNVSTFPTFIIFIHVNTNS